MFFLTRAVPAQAHPTPVAPQEALQLRDGQVLELAAARDKSNRVAWEFRWIAAESACAKGKPNSGYAAYAKGKPNSGYAAYCSLLNPRASPGASPCSARPTLACPTLPGVDHNL